MKKSSIFSVYLAIFAVVTALGYLLDGYFGIYRQVGFSAVLVGIGWLFGGRGQKESSEKGYKNVRSSLSGVIVFSCLILAALAIRLLFAQLVSDTLLPHADKGLWWRVVSTVFIPSFFTLELIRIAERMQPFRHPMCKMLIVGMCFTPFCTHALFIPSAFLFGAGCFGIKEYLSGKYRLEMFVSYYLVMMFYDTLSISVGSIDFNLTLRMAFSFLLISLSLGVLFAYLALRPIKERKFRVAECLTVLLICAILLLVAIAL